jgi:hypothetical protein
VAISEAEDFHFFSELNSSHREKACHSNQLGSVLLENAVKVM